MTVVWCDYVRETLAVAGLQRGAARERIIDLLADQKCALTAQEIETELRAEGHPTARATIYRVLELLCDYGLLDRVTVGEGQARFEPIDPSGAHHHHVVCDQCGRLVPFHDPALERAISRLSDRIGMHVDHHEVLLHGVCERCD